MELDVSPEKKIPNKENEPDKETKSTNISNSVSNVAIDQSGLQSLLPRCMQGRFAEKSLESLYQMYFKRQKRDALQVMLALAILFDTTVIILYSINYDEEKIVTISVSSLAMLCEIILMVLCKLRMFSDATFNALPVILWLILGLQIYVDLGFEGRPMSPADSVSWQTFYVYASYVMLPIHLRWCFILSTSSCLLHTLIVSLVWNASSDNLFLIGNQVSLLVSS